MKLKKIHIKREIKIVVLTVLAFSAIALTEKKEDQRTCNAIHIDIDNIEGNHYLDNNDIYQLMTSDESDFVLGSFYNRIDLRTIEDRIAENKYINSAEVHTDYRGNLNLKITLRIPIARIVLNGTTDMYLDQSGNLFPVSDRYTSRVLLISGNQTEVLAKEGFDGSKVNRDLLKLIQFIHASEFWYAQISQCDINSKGEITMYPMVTKQSIEFGKPENIEKKFQKLEIFYKRILPGKGWNFYSRVNIQYKDQIICE
ncbi:cell division protein FtsQ/DivIB [Bacteroidota bacterium]